MTGLSWVIGDQQLGHGQSPIGRETIGRNPILCPLTAFTRLSAITKIFMHLPTTGSEKGNDGDIL